VNPHDFQHCRFEPEGAVVTITINRPQVLNAMTPEAHFELDAAFNLYRDDPSLQVAIITGAGDKAFCVGTDLKALALTHNHHKPVTGFAGITSRFDLFKPVIAAVNGMCFGGGAEIVAACDLALAAGHAEFGLLEPRVGLAALGGGALQRLARQMPMKDAMMLILTGQRIGALEAKRISLINEVVPNGELMARVNDLAQKILECAPLAVQASKQVMLQSLHEPDLQASRKAQYDAAERMLASADALEGPLAFAEKRKPVWTGR
jgi:crotonobetainyl-CoA hydratase